MMKQLAAVICVISIGIGTVFCECGKTTYYVSGTADKCPDYSCIECCSRTSYDGVCTHCGPATQNLACYQDESYTVYATRYIMGNCPHGGTCSDGFIQGLPTKVTCYYTSNGECS